MGGVRMMRVQKGLVKYKDRSDILCTYGTTEDGKTLMQYIYEYIERDLDKTISDEGDLFGLDKKLLKEIYITSHNERELNEHNRFERLKSSANLEKVIAYFTEKENKPCSGFSARVKLDTELKDFILNKTNKK